MKFALCNEMFGDLPFADLCRVTSRLGYSGIELAPFTLLPGEPTVDARDVPRERRLDVKQQAADAGLEVIGLHWLLAKTDGFYLTSPEVSVRRETIEYFKGLAELCSDVGGHVMVLGSPQQRNLLPGVAYDAAEQYAAEVLCGAMQTCADCGVTIALEPLGPAECDFLNSAESAIRLAELVASPHCKLHLDVKAMASEPQPIDQTIRQSADWMVHFHANDPNLLGPGMGDVDFAPIFAALKDVHYDGWVSVEVFDYEPGPEKIAQASIEYMRRYV